MKTIVEGVFQPDPNASVPVLLKFQNGSLSAINKEKTIYCQVEHNDTKKRDALVVSSGHIYSGPIIDYPTNDLTDNYIVVKNKTTNKVRIIPIRHAQLNNTIYEKLDKEREKKVYNKDLSNKLLLKQFGGRKALRTVENSEKMKVNIEVVREELEYTVNETKLEKHDDGKNIDNAEYMAIISPKCNKGATAASDVYDVKDVVPNELLNRLEEEAKVVYSTKPESLPIKSEYLLDCIKRIQAKELQSVRDFRDIKLIIYMDALHRVISSRSPNLKTVELSGITEKVENDIRLRFSDPTSNKPFARTSYTSEKALLYYIVLALLISDKFEVDAELISKNLNVPEKKIKTFAHIVNALPKARTSILKLRLPSEMPPVPTDRNFQKKKR